MKIKLECHSSTSYEEIINFLNNNLNKKVKFHYEIKGFNEWENDDIKEITLNKEGLEWIHNYLGKHYEYRTSNNDSYAHNIEIIE